MPEQKARHRECRLGRKRLVSLTAGNEVTAMHSIQLVDLAAVLALHGPSLLYQQNLISEEVMQKYWIVSRARFDQWHRRLGQHREFELDNNQRALVDWWRENPGLSDEILLSEPLTRVFAAIGMALDLSTEIEEISPITQSVYVSHLEARKRVLQIIVDDHTMPMGEAVRLNRLRSTTERWTDTLLGYLTVQAGDCTMPLGFDHSRIRAFADEARQLPLGAARETTCWLLSAAMRDAVIRLSCEQVAFAKENKDVADSVLMSLRPDLFDSVGVLKSLWLHRLERGAEQTDRVLKQLALADLSDADILGSYETVRGSNFGRW